MRHFYSGYFNGIKYIIFYIDEVYFISLIFKIINATYAEVIK